MNYDSFAGQNAARLAALSDGVFSIAMTLLVLDLRAPAVEAIHNDAELWRALIALGPRLMMYIVTFLTLGIFWVGQQTQLNHLARANRSLSWIHIVFLFFVSITPFSTNLMAQYTSFRVALIAYWANIVFLGLTLYISWICAVREGLVDSGVPLEISDGIKRRIVVSQSLYAFGALLCIVNPYWSLAVFVVVQLNFALGLIRKS
ncbi:MAG: DUF1211 domain-containing protein [Acidobacteria bacterium]|nr:DUF1211 domain-containing protein [Acidobacteriota bacterium]